MKTLARKLAKKWLTKKFGPRCEDVVFGCICCDKWKAFDLLFGKDKPKMLEEEIDFLKEELKWRVETLQRYQKVHTVTPELMGSESIVPTGGEMIASQNKSQDSAPS